MASTLLQRTRPFCAAPTRSRPTRVLLLTQIPRQIQIVRASAQDAPGGSSQTLPFAFLSIAVGALGLTANSAVAADAVIPSVPGISAEDVQIMVASQTGTRIEETIVSLLFGTVVFLLAIVTAGVLYINIKQFLDGRQEADDRKAPAAPSRSNAKSGKAADDDDEDDEDKVVPLKRASRIKKEKGKGFASAADLSSRK